MRMGIEFCWKANLWYDGILGGCGVVEGAAALLERDRALHGDFVDRAVVEVERPVAVTRTKLP